MKRLLRNIQTSVCTTPSFNVNQLLFECYNGKFPKIRASVIQLKLSFKDEIQVTKEVVLRCISDLLSETSLIKRLFGDQLDSSKELTEAKGIIWQLDELPNSCYQILSSDYWMNEDDFVKSSHSGVLHEDEIEH